MTKDQVLQKLVTLRLRIYSEADVSADAEGWENTICDAIDKVTDMLEFPAQPTLQSQED